MKNCKNCANASGSIMFGKCYKSGYYIETQRKFPNIVCNKDFSGWQPKPSIFTRIKKFFTGW